VNNSEEKASIRRRDFIKTGLKIAVVSGIAGSGLLSACADSDTSEGQKVSPPEDLMQEHGVLRRILMIYDNCKMQLLNNQTFLHHAILESAHIIRSFIEDYHEKQEEDYLFPRMTKANQLQGMVQILWIQHKAGRVITDEIMQLCKSSLLSEADNKKLVGLLTSFNTMYAPHAAHEDTVLFPAFRKIVSRKEYNRLGEEFEDNEHKLFGENGFETVIQKVENIEKELGIYDLAQFTTK
jgi:hemerythrin-like domain-containing protein